jgi:hypothetical protein
MNKRLLEYKVWRDKRIKIFHLYLYNPNLTAGVVSKFEPQIIMTRKFTIAATGDSCQP